MNFVFNLLDAGTSTGATGGSWQTIVLMAALFGVMYFVMIRPQKKKDKAYKDLLASIEVGDEVTTIGGFYGTVSKIKDEKIVIEAGTNEKSSLYVYKWAIKDVKKKEQA